MSEAHQSSITRTVIETNPQTSSTSNQPEELVLHLAPTEDAPRVRWTADTVDNEFAGKRKSKCCCIYKKSKKWNDSSSDEDSDCETGNCHGHVEKRHNNQSDN